jgi:SAM-dependent methyltransferase
MMNALKSRYRQEQFFPTWLGVFVNPFYFARSGLAEAMAECAPQLKGRLLDVGCGTKPYRSLFSVDSYVGLDVDSEVARQRATADFLYDGREFPFETASFDAVVCNQVLEHVFNPDEFVREIVRVLKPRGHLLLTVPFAWDEHEQPFDYARYSSFGLSALLGRHGVEIIVFKKLGADASTLFQLANAYFFKVTQALPRWLQLGFNLSVMAAINLLGLAARQVLPENPDFYLDNVVLAEKIV